MSDIDIRVSEGDSPDAFLLFDTIWNPNDGVGDFALAPADEKLNRGGLRAQHALDTAVVLALFTDKRIDPSHPLVYLADGDRRGYWGDGIDVRTDLSETSLGSYLWLLERAPLTVRGQPIARWAEQFAMEALMSLRDQGVVVRIDVSASADELHNRLDMIVRLFGRDGLNVYDRKFDLIWKQVAA